MENSNSSKKFLCIKTFKCDSKAKLALLPASLVPELSKCPANPEMIMAALQFMTDEMEIQISISDKPIDFNSGVNK